MDLKKILETVLENVPTPDNCQPWHYKWSSQPPELTIYYDGPTAAHPLNKNGAGSLLALGFVLETIDLASRASGFVAHVELVESALLRLGEPHTIKVGTVKFVNAPAAHDPLYDVLALRETNREAFSRQPPSRDLTDALGATNVHIVRSSRFAVLRYLYSTELLSWKRPEIINAIFGSIKTPLEMTALRTGLNLNALGLNWMEKKIVHYLKNHPKVVERFGPLFGCFALIHPLIRQVFSSSIFGCVTARERTADGLIDAGRRTLRIWLKLNRASFGFHPYCAGTVQIFEGHQPKNEARLKNIFSMNAEEIPVLFFRSGRTKLLPSDKRSLKQPVRLES